MRLNLQKKVDVSPLISSLHKNVAREINDTLVLVSDREERRKINANEDAEE